MKIEIHLCHKSFLERELQPLIVVADVDFTWKRLRCSPCAQIRNKSAAARDALCV